MDFRSMLFGFIIGASATFAGVLVADYRTRRELGR